ncbi:hypothetical protein CFOL_v3_34591, partial [Cephalotus follicularis]
QNLSIVKEWLTRIRWLDLISKCNNVFTQCVQHFYANLAPSHNATIQSFVKGVWLSLTPESLGELLDIPCEGLRDLSKIDKGHAIQIVLNFPQAIVHTPCNLRSLLVTCRILLLIITHTFLSRSDSYNCITKTELRLMACIENGEPINLPHLIINHML